jgi:hypothetical protein
LAEQRLREFKIPGYRVNVVTLLLPGLLSMSLTPSFKPDLQPAAVTGVQTGAPRQVLEIGGGKIEIEVGQDGSILQTDDVLDWVRRAAGAVSVYYGSFPVEHARVKVIEGRSNGQEIRGTTWGNVDGVQGLSRMRLDGGVTKPELDDDWTMTHEFVHLALASLPDESHWLEEGLATYVEPIARAQAGQLPASEVWLGMIQGMPHGEPQPGDQGLNQTHTWGRTYWGGAMFCLLADVKIREATQNRKGLQDALRAIVAARETIDKDRTVEQVLSAADQATGTTVLSDLYNTWKSHPVSVDLNHLWLELGVQLGSGGIEFDSQAPLASIREAITKPPARR